MQNLLFQWFFLEPYVDKATDTVKGYFLSIKKTIIWLVVLYLVIKWFTRK